MNNMSIKTVCPREDPLHVLNFLEFVENSRAIQPIKDHTRTLVQSYLAKLYDQGLRPMKLEEEEKVKPC